MSDRGSGNERGENAGLQAQVRALAGVIDSLSALVDQTPGAGVLDLVEEIEIQHRRLAAVRAKVMARAKDSGLWAAAGARSFNAWASTRLGGDPTEVGRTVGEMAKLREHLPLMEEALAQGSVSGGHVSALVRTGLASDKQIQALAHEEVGEAFLVENAKALTVPKFRQLVKSWAYHVDPDAADGRWQKHVDDEYLVLAETLNGFHLQGFLSKLNGQMVAKAITAAVGIPPEGDERTLVQRNAHGLSEIANQVLSGGAFMKNATIRPHLNVTVDYNTFQNLLTPNETNTPVGGPNPEGQALTPGTGAHFSAGSAGTGAGGVQGEFALGQGLTPARGLTSGRGPVVGDGSPLTAGQLAFLTCDSVVGRIVFGPDSEVLNIGRARRVVTGPQRRAIEARDRHCQYPGCYAHSNTSEIHHIKHWAAGGETSVENSILLCRFHHQHIHAQKISIRRQNPDNPNKSDDPAGQQLPNGLTRQSSSPGDQSNDNALPAPHLEPGDKWAFYTKNGDRINNWKHYNRKQTPHDTTPPNNQTPTAEQNQENKEHRDKPPPPAN